VHDGTLDAMSRLAAVFCDSGKRRQALQLETEVLEVNRRLHGSEHPNTLTAANNLAGTYADMGSHAAALLLLTEALEGRRRTLGNDSPETMNTISSLAALHSRLGNLDLALPLTNESVERQRRVLGSEHPETLLSVGNLGVLHMRMGDHAVATPLLREASNGLAAVYGPQHPDAEFYQEELDDNMRYLSDSAAAAELQRFQRQLQLSSNHPGVSARVVSVGADGGGVSSSAQPGELEGSEVRLLRFDSDSSRYTVETTREDGDRATLCLTAQQLRLAVGTTVVVVTDPEQAEEQKGEEEGGGRGDKLTGRKAVIEGWDTATTRYRVRVGVEPRELPPGRCRAMVDGAGAT
jgi:tetratricopeptide (TPR) repeat protein